MSDPKHFPQVSFESAKLSSSILLSNNLNELFYYQSGISINATSTITISIPGIFYNSTGTNLIRVGIIRLIAISREYNTVKCVHYPFVTFRSNITFYNTLGTAFNQLSVESGQSQSGGDALSAVINGVNMDINIDLTDGAGAVTDGELFVYIEKTF